MSFRASCLAGLCSAALLITPSVAAGSCNLNMKAGFNTNPCLDVQSVAGQTVDKRHFRRHQSGSQSNHHAARRVQRDLSLRRSSQQRHSIPFREPPHRRQQLSRARRTGAEIHGVLPHPRQQDGGTANPWAIHLGCRLAGRVQLDPSTRCGRRRMCAGPTLSRGRSSRPNPPGCVASIATNQTPPTAQQAGTWMLSTRSIRSAEHRS